MKLKSFNYLLSLLIILFFTPILGEEKIDIWKDKKETPTKSMKLKETESKKETNIKSSQTIQATEKIQIEESLSIIYEFLDQINLNYLCLFYLILFQFHGLKYPGLFEHFC